MPGLPATLGPFIHVHSLLLISYFHKSQATPAVLKPPNKNKFPEVSTHVAPENLPPGSLEAAGTPCVPKTGLILGILEPCTHVHSFVEGSYFQSVFLN